MFFRWLKRYMPRSLYGRAALILVLPVVTLQLVVSVVFIQRHFEGVTVQMTRELARAVNLVVADLPDRSNGLRLGIRPREVADDALPEVNQRRWYDFTGLVVIRELDTRISALERILLPSDREVVLFLRRDDQLYRASVDRSRVSASNPHQLFVNMVFFGALMTLIAFLYMRNQLRPITRLAAAAEAFGVDRVAGFGKLDLRNGRPIAAVHEGDARDGLAVAAARAKVELFSGVDEGEDGRTGQELFGCLLCWTITDAGEAAAAGEDRA